MKKSKLGFGVFFVGLISLPIFLSSCSSVYTIVRQPIPDDGSDAYLAYDFIAKHSYSFAGWNETTKNACFGTGWIYKQDVLPRTYWMATNLHVELGIEEIQANRFFCAHESNISNPSKKIPFDHSYFEVLCPEDFQPLKQNEDQQMDLAIGKITFPLESPLPTNLLDINDVIDEIPDNNNTFYIGGFPIQNASQAYTYFNAMEFNTKQTSKYTFIDDRKHGGTPRDVNCVELVMDDNQFPYRLSGGSSGSLVVWVNPITKDVKVVGIYWGYYTTSNNNQKKFQAAFDLFKSEHYVYNGKNYPAYNFWSNASNNSLF